MKKLSAPCKPLISLILIATALAVFTGTAYASYLPPVTIMGRVTHGTEPVWGVMVTANTTSERGTPTGSGTGTTDSVGFYQIRLDHLDPDAGYYELSANYTDYLGVNYRGVAYGKISPGMSTVNILLTNASERATPAPTAVPAAMPTAMASTKPAVTGRGPGGCGVFMLLPVSIVGVVAGNRLWHQKK